MCLPPAAIATVKLVAPSRLHTRGPCRRSFFPLLRNFVFLSISSCFSSLSAPLPHSTAALAQNSEICSWNENLFSIVCLSVRILPLPLPLALPLDRVCTRLQQHYTHRKGARSRFIGSDHEISNRGSQLTIRVIFLWDSLCRSVDLFSVDP